MMNNSGGNSEALAAHDWAGEAGARWLGQLDRFESMIEPIGEALLARAAYAAGERVVDIGCGGGWTTRRIAASSEEHTSELQSLTRTSYVDFCLKKKNDKTQ